VKALDGGERVIGDPVIATQRSFVYLYLCNDIGALVGQITMVYADRYVGFWLSFFLPTSMFDFCPIVLVVFRLKYIEREPTGSVLEKSVALISFALKGRVSINPAES
jgi:POT family proton-dependent oligopeptide transporter